MKFIRFLVTILYILFLAGGRALPVLADGTPSGDYPEKPTLELNYSGVEVHLSAGFDGRKLDGEVTYRFTPRHSYVDAVTWAAPGMDIQDITMNGSEITYEQEGDSIRIAFDDFLVVDESSAITINYETEPKYGVHFKYSGTIFTSNLPGSVAHWLPGPIYPGATAPVELVFDVPGTFTAVSGGELTAEEPTDRGNRFIWSHSSAVPLSELAFAVGEFEMDETFSGTKNLRVYHESGVMDSGERQQLLNTMARRTRDLERRFRNEIPVPSMQAVVLKDDRWETRSYSAGMTYLFRSHGDLALQLDRSLTAQWFGIALRPAQWQHASYIILLQALIAEQENLDEWEGQEDPLRNHFEVPESLEQAGSMEYWQWARFYLRKGPEENREASVVHTTLSDVFRPLAGERGAWSASDFSGLIYQNAGRWVDPPVIARLQPKSDYQFQVTMSEVRGSERVLLEITPRSDITDRSFPITVAWNRDGSISEREYAFDGSGDTIEVDPGGHINNFWITGIPDEITSITVDKPFSFWLYQIRRDSDPDRRKQAAEALKSHASDPDLQLAIQDVIARESEPDVLAAMYSLLAEITSGASGTEQRFIDGLSSSHQQIRTESLKALRAYPNSSRVEEEVYSIIQTSDDLDLVNEAIRTYRHLIDDSDFRDFAIRFLREDRQDLHFSKTLLQEMFETPIEETTVETASMYLFGEFSFDLRWEAYRLLRQHDTNGEWQEEFIAICQDDPDPRIRFLTLFSLSALDPEDRGPFLKSRMLNEYENRILQRIEDLALSE